jgi:hypothetical protein
LGLNFKNFKIGIMKKIFLVGGLFLLGATVTFAKDRISRKERKEARIEKREARKELRWAVDRSEVSIASKNQFAIDFPDANNVGYIRTKNFDEMTFLQGKKKLRAYYDYHSQLVGTTQQVAFTNLPKSGQSDILKHYPDYTISNVIKYRDYGDNEEDIELYGRSFDTDNYFVELKKANEQIIVQVDLSGNVSYFASLP